MVEPESFPECALCNPYAYRHLIGLSFEKPLCYSHRMEAPSPFNFGPLLPPGWWPSWRRGIWA